MRGTQAIQNSSIKKKTCIRVMNEDNSAQILKR